MVTVRQGNEPLVSVDATGSRGRVHAHGHPPAEAPVNTASRRLWAWNKADVSQFDGAAAAHHLYADGALSVVADATLPEGNKLRLTALTGAGGGTVTWLATAPLVFASANMTHEFRYTVAGLDVEYGGVAFLCEVSGGNLYGHSHVSGVAGWRNRWDAGLNVDDGSTIRTLHTVGAGLGVNAHCKVRVNADKPAGAAPRFVVAGESAVQFTQQNNAWKWDDPPWAAYPAGWNGLTLARFGLTIKAGAGAAPNFDLLDFEVWSSGNPDVSV